eukprot:3723615-Karenia_brevis.AAC.1
MPRSSALEEEPGRPTIFEKRAHPGVERFLPGHQAPAEVRPYKGNLGDVNPPSEYALGSDGG